MNSDSTWIKYYCTIVVLFIELSFIAWEKTGVRLHCNLLKTNFRCALVIQKRFKCECGTKNMEKKIQTTVLKNIYLYIFQFFQNITFFIV